MGDICAGLEAVTVSHGPGVEAEARVLMGWLRDRIGQCGENRAHFTIAPLAEAAAGACTVEFRYAEKKNFSWQADLQEGWARFQADFGTGRTTLSAAVNLLSPENALSEAMFF